MANNISIIITAKDEASKVLQGLGREVGETEKRSRGFSESLGSVQGQLAGVSASAGVALFGVKQFMDSSITSANNLNSSLTGLNSVARAFGQDAAAAKRAAQELAKDGLMTVSDSATGLKNLLAAGFGLDQAVTLMTRFKDSAAFGKQGALSFGEAIRGATEGIKNGNSILVDNAGVTKNLSMMLEEAGFSAQDLMRASSDAGVRQAIFNGILKETTAQTGDASRLTDSYAGKQAMAAASTEALKQSLGSALQAALLPFLQAITPIIVNITEWISTHQRLAAAIAISAAVFLGIIAVIGLVVVAAAAVAAVFGAVSVAVVAAVVAAAAAIATFVGFVVTNWETVRNTTVSAFQGVTNAVGSALAWIRDNWVTIVGILTGPVGFAVSQIISHWSGLTSFFSSVPGRIGDVLSGVTSAITTPFAAAFEFIRTLPARMVELFTGVGGSIRSVIGNIDLPGPLGLVRDVIPGFAGGGFTGIGSANEVAGVVHRGEYVVPASQVDQSTGLPMSRSSSVTIENFNVNNNVDAGLVVRQIGWQLST